MARIAQVHPQYEKADAKGVGNRAGIWEQMLDTLAGERAVKAAGEKYLPKTELMQKGIPFIAKDEEAAGYISNGTGAYENYLARARFPDWTKDTAISVMGLLNQIPPTVELPDRLASMMAMATADKRDIYTLFREVTERQVATGRVGLLLDTDSGRDAKVTPHIVAYYEKTILNWHTRKINGKEVLDYLLLDESGPQFDPVKLVYEDHCKFRVCALDKNGVYYSLLIDKEFSPFDYLEQQDESQYPNISGKTLNFIPFVFINASDIQPDISNPPLLPVSNLALSAYRLSADYRHSLFLCGQPTLFGKGMTGKENLAVGSGTAIISDSKDADMRYLEITGSGLAEMGSEYKEIKEEAAKKGVELAEGGQESGAALNTRLTIKTANLHNIASAQEAGMTKILRMSAEWVGADPDKVKVQVNKDFKDEDVLPQDLVQLSGLIDSGRFTEEDYHQLLVDKEYTKFDDFNDWKEHTTPAGAMPGFESNYSLPGEKTSSTEEKEPNAQTDGGDGNSTA